MNPSVQTASTPPPSANAAPAETFAGPKAPAYEFGKTKLSSLATSRGIVCVIYGDAGGGKTTLLHGFPPDRTTIFDIDGGAGVLLEKGWNGSVEPAAKDLSNLKHWVEWVTTSPHGFTTVVVDSCSNLERRMVFLIGDKRQKEFVAVQEYGDASSKMRSYFLALRDLSAKGINVVFVCHAKSDVKGREGVIFPFLSDKLAIEITGLVDICGYLGINPDGTRYLQFAPAPNLRTKSRFSIVQPFEELNLAAVFARIFKDRKQRAEEAMKPAEIVPGSAAVVPEKPKEDLKGEAVKGAEELAKKLSESSDPKEKAFAEKLLKEIEAKKTAKK